MIQTKRLTKRRTIPKQKRKKMPKPPRNYTKGSVFTPVLSEKSSKKKRNHEKHEKARKVEEKKRREDGFPGQAGVWRYL